MKNKAHEIMYKLDKQLNINCFSEEEYVDEVLKIGKENNLPIKDISNYISFHLIEEIISFDGNEKEICDLVYNILKEGY